MKSESVSAWPGLAWPGPARSTAQACSSGLQLLGWSPGRFPASFIFFLLVRFQQQHDCIISRAYVTEQDALRLRLSLFFPLFSVFLKEWRLAFFFLFFLWRCFMGNRPRTEEKQTNKKLKSAQTTSTLLCYIIFIFMTQHSMCFSNVFASAHIDWLTGIFITSIMILEPCYIWTCK